MLLALKKLDQTTKFSNIYNKLYYIYCINNVNTIILKRKTYSKTNVNTKLVKTKSYSKKEKKSTPTFHIKFLALISNIYLHFVVVAL